MQDQKLHIPIEKLKNEIKEPPVKINSQVSSDLISIMANIEKSQLTPFIKLFWGEEQQKYQHPLNH